MRFSGRQCNEAPRHRCRKKSQRRWSASSEARVCVSSPCFLLFRTDPCEGGVGLVVLVVVVVVGRVQRQAPSDSLSHGAVLHDLS